jgi:hypothetical protein
VTYLGSGHALPAVQSVHDVCPVFPPVVWPDEQAIGLDVVYGHMLPAGHIVQSLTPERLYSPLLHAVGLSGSEVHSFPAGHAEQVAVPCTMKGYLYIVNTDS